MLRSANRSWFRSNYSKGETHKWSKWLLAIMLCFFFSLSQDRILWFAFHSLFFGRYIYGSFVHLLCCCVWCSHYLVINPWYVWSVKNFLMHSTCFSRCNYWLINDVKMVYYQQGLFFLIHRYPWNNFDLSTKKKLTYKFIIRGRGSNFYAPQVQTPANY